MTEGLRADFSAFLPLGVKEAGSGSGEGAVFHIYSSGLKTDRDETVYDFNRTRLTRRVKQCIEDINIRGKRAEFSKAKERSSLYRPFCRKWIFFDRVLNEEVDALPTIFPSPRDRAALCK